MAGRTIETAELQRHGLYDPTAPNAADRLALLRFLEEHGLDVADMVDAQARGRLTGVLGDRLLRPTGRFTREGLAARAGMSPARIDEIQRTVGLGPFGPGNALYDEGDALTFQAFEASAHLLGERGTRQFTRALGSALGRLAETVVSLFLVNVEAPMVGRHPSELELAKASLEACRLLTQVPQLMDTLFRAHVAEAILRSQRAREITHSYDTVRLAVGFVDLVGFTPLSQQLPARELVALVEEFEARAFDVAARHDGRVVKLIGDEVMFVAPSAAAGCEIAIELAHSFNDRPEVTPRGGVAVGELLTHGGDYYGPVVNLASRIGDLAIPHEVLVTTEVQDESERAGAAIGFVPAGRRMLKGFAEPVELLSARRG